MSWLDISFVRGEPRPPFFPIVFLFVVLEPVVCIFEPGDLWRIEIRSDQQQYDLASCLMSMYTPLSLRMHIYVHDLHLLHLVCSPILRLLRCSVS